MISFLIGLKEKVRLCSPRAVAGKGSNQGLIFQASGAVIGSTGFLWRALSEECVRARVRVCLICFYLIFFSQRVVFVSYQSSVFLWAPCFFLPAAK